MTFYVSKQAAYYFLKSNTLYVNLTQDTDLQFMNALFEMNVTIMKSLFPKPLTSTPTCYSFALLTSFCNLNSSSLIKYVPIVGYFHLT